VHSVSLLRSARQRPFTRFRFLFQGGCRVSIGFPRVCPCSPTPPQPLPPSTYPILLACSVPYPISPPSVFSTRSFWGNRFSFELDLSNIAKPPRRTTAFSLLAALLFLLTFSPARPPGITATFVAVRLRNRLSRVLRFLWLSGSVEECASISASYQSPDPLDGREYLSLLSRA